MKPQIVMRCLCATALSLPAASCLEPPQKPTVKETVERMTPEEKVAVVNKALAASNTDPEAVQPSEIDWKLELAEMKGVLRPSDAETMGLDLAFADREAEIGQWMKSQKYAQLVALERQMHEAAAAKDLKTLDAAKAEAQPLRAELKQLVEKHRNRILEMLTENNRLKWQTHRLTERMRNLMQPLKLTDEQMTELRSRAWRSVEQFAAAKQGFDPHQEAFVNLEKEMEQEVLRRDQRRTYQTIKKDNPLRSVY
jgi:chromosome segregation ATPase